LTELGAYFIKLGPDQLCTIKIDTISKACSANSLLEAKAAHRNQIVLNEKRIIYVCKISLFIDVELRTGNPKINENPNLSFKI